jgi:hypothetical protein
VLFAGLPVILVCVALIAHLSWRFPETKKEGRSQGPAFLGVA